MNYAATHGKGLGYAEEKGAICCDVLDAWFDPSPRAIAAFSGDGVSLRTSPDVYGDPLIQNIAASRGLEASCVFLGAGSSEIIHRVLPGLLGEGEVVVLDPTYSEYSHVIERAGKQIRRFALLPENDFRIDMESLRGVARNVSALILVNPNNPTGQALTRSQVLEVKEALNDGALLWVDEAYVDYCPPETSVEVDACSTPGLVVVKSLSKAYALSGVRAAYLVASGKRGKEIRDNTPPWIIGTSAQKACIAALSDPDYYGATWDESRAMLIEYADLIRRLGYRVRAGRINAVLVDCPQGRKADEWSEELAGRGLIVRVPTGMGEVLGDRYIRIGLLDRSFWPQVMDALSGT